MEFEKGDRFIIHKEPNGWSSRFNDFNPIGKSIYPYIGTVERITEGCMTCGKYGWDMDDLLDDNNIKKLVHRDDLKKGEFYVGYWKSFGSMANIIFNYCGDLSGDNYFMHANSPNMRVGNCCSGAAIDFRYATEVEKEELECHITKKGLEPWIADVISSPYFDLHGDKIIVGSSITISSKPDTWPGIKSRGRKGLHVVPYPYKAIVAEIYNSATPSFTCKEGYSWSAAARNKKFYDMHEEEITTNGFDNSKLVVGKVYKHFDSDTYVFYCGKVELYHIFELINTDYFPGGGGGSKKVDLEWKSRGKNTYWITENYKLVDTSTTYSESVMYTLGFRVDGKDKFSHKTHHTEGTDPPLYKGFEIGKVYKNKEVRRGGLFYFCGLDNGIFCFEALDPKEGTYIDCPVVEWKSKGTDRYYRYEGLEDNFNPIPHITVLPVDVALKNNEASVFHKPVIVNSPLIVVSGSESVKINLKQIKRRRL